MRHICDNCGMDWHIDSLEEINDYSLRVDAGGTVPSGECPECGSLCYPKKKSEKGDKAVNDAIVYLEAFKGLADSLLDGNKNPDKKFLRALVRDTPKLVKKLKKLI
jgi:hypothetical protein